MRSAEPITAGSLLSRSWTIYREDVFGYTLLVLLCSAPSLGLNVLRASLGVSEKTRLALVASSDLVDFVLMAMAMAIVILGVYRGLRGSHMELGEVISQARFRWLAALGASLLVYLAVMVGLVFLILPGLVVLCGSVAVVPLVVIEKLPVGRAWERSWALTQGHRGAIFLGLGTVILLKLALGLVFSDLFRGPIEPGPLWLLPLIKGLVGVVIETWGFVLLALIYHDLRHASGENEQSELVQVFA